MRLAWTILAAGAIAAAAPALHAESATVTGELVTIMCVEGHGDDGRGAAHVDCAIRCAKDGYQLGVITDDGMLYKLTGPFTGDKNAKLQSLLAKTVTATGDVTKSEDGRILNATQIAEAPKH